MHILQKATIIFSFSLFICPPTFAEDPEQTTKEAWQISHQIEKQIQSTQKDLKAQLETYSDAKISKLVNENFKSAEKQLVSQGERLEKQSQQQLESMRYLFAESKDFLSILTYCSYTIFFLLLAGASFLFWWHGKSFKDYMKNELAEKMIEFEKMKSNYEKVLEENKDLRKRLESLTKFTNKKIVWAFENAEIEASKEIESIEKKGFRVRQCLPGQEKTIAPENCDFMIYSFCKSDQSLERLQEIVSFLDTLGKKVPLIIYTYNAPNLDKDEFALLKNKNFVLSNMPLTLQIYFNSLIRD